MVSYLKCIARKGRPYISSASSYYISIRYFFSERCSPPAAGSGEKEFLEMQAAASGEK